METRKRPYESPKTWLTQIETESSICGGSIDLTNQDGKTNVTINDQAINSSTANDFSADSWDSMGIN
ncbi:hypothetical protein [uncultured Duncaniella sp.]|uniref:hypothetical protein n=1 Tax=uncultured Duncaniella sp. TaxID=2768039 RepID=UPI0025E2028A|nr:hypothetical protein [uncultured Duncaniella sp.]